MERLLAIGISNALAAGVLALLALAAARLLRRPAVTHALRLLVLAKLLTPPLVVVPIFPAPAEQPAPAAASLRAQVDVPPREELWPGSEAFVVPAEPLAPAEESLLFVEPLLRPMDDPRWRLEAPEPQTLDSPHEAVAAQTVPVDPASPEIHTAPPTSIPTSSPRFDPRTWIQVATALWAGGSLLWCAVALLRIVRFHRLLRCAKPAPPAIQQTARALAARIGLRSCPVIELVPGSLAPLVWFMGRRPRLLLAARLLERLDAQQTSGLVAHELAHLRRRDHWVRLVELAATALYWWNPVLWWARRELREAEEQCCDAWAVWALRGSARAYAETLLETVDLLSQTPLAFPPLASGLAHERILRRRLTMIMDQQTSRRLSWAARCALLALAAALLPLVPGRAQNEPAPPAGQAQSEGTAPSAIDREELSSTSEVAEPGALEPTKAIGAASVEQNTPTSPEISAALEHLRVLEEAAQHTEKMHRQGFATKAQLETAQRAVEDARQQLQAQRRAAHEQAKADLIQAQTELEIAKISLREAVEGTFPQEEKVQQANVVLAEENVVRAQEKLENDKSLHEKGFVSKQQVEASQLAAERAQLELENTKTALKVTLEFTHPKILKELEAQIAEAKANLARAKVRVDAARDELATPGENRSQDEPGRPRTLNEAVAELEQAEARVRSLRLRAFDVQRQLAEKGTDQTKRQALMDEARILLGERQLAQEHVARLLPYRTQLRERRMKQMRERARVFEVAALAPDKGSAVVLKMQPQPVVRYSEVLWAEDATVWIWRGSEGRPHAALKVEAYPFPTESGEPLWSYLMTSLSPQQIHASRAEGWHWQSSKPGIAMRSVPDAPSPAAELDDRLAQMQAISERFRVVNLGPGYGQLENHVDSMPALRYPNSQMGMVDGALFFFKLGTDPTAILLIEARSSDGAETAWHYGLAPLGGGIMVGHLDEKEVWRSPNGNPGYLGETYWSLEETQMAERAQGQTPEQRKTSVEELRKQIQDLQQRLRELESADSSSDALPF